MVQKIDLNDWILSGGGAVGVTYFHKTDPALLLKFDLRNLPVSELEQELEIARSVYDLGLPTPEPGYVVTDGERYGTVYHRIVNKISYARYLGEHPDEVDSIAAEFASIARKIHSTRADNGRVRNVKDVFRKSILANPIRDEITLKKALKLLETLPDGNTAVHGDLHFGNIIKADGRNYLIDISNFSCGHPNFDLAMTFAVSRMPSANPDLFRDMFHCRPEDGARFWQSFLKHYFGPDVDEDAVTQMLMPFLALRIFCMETETGSKIPDAVSVAPLSLLDNITL